MDKQLANMYLLGIDGRFCPTLSDLQEAAKDFAPEGGTDSWKRGCLVGQRIMAREYMSAKQFRDEFVAGFLNSWRCRFPNKNAEELLDRMKDCRDKVSHLPSHLVDLRTEHLPLVNWCFERLSRVHGAGGTVRSKTLSAMRPALFVMWDEAIASRFGFERNANGYCRFLWLMAEHCRALCKEAEVPLCEAGATRLERSLKIRDRKMPIPFAKLLDQWNWKMRNEA